MLAGEGADRFARDEGLAPRDATDGDTLLAPSALEAWNRWRAAPRTVDQSRDAGATPPRPVDRGPDAADGGGRLFGVDQPAAHSSAETAPVDDSPRDERRWRHHDTIGVLAIDSRGTLAGACSTSGTPFKRPGRVGDSPIIGHGLYVDPAAGAATATGAGELIMGICGSFVVVEAMRRGAGPPDAVREALQRIVDGGPLTSHQQVAFIALRPDGTWAAGALREGYRTTIWSNNGGQAVEPAVVLIAGS